MLGLKVSDRLGIPRAAGSSRLVAAWFVDTLGSGMFLPFIVVFLVSVSDVPLSLIGAALSLGAALVIPAPAAAGWLVDRFGARPVLIGGNLVEAAAFAGIMEIRLVWQIVCFAFVVNLGRNLFWVANSSLVSEAFPVSQRARWFGMVNAVRSAGAGIGGVLAVPALAGPAASGYELLALANAGSFVVAAGLIFTWRPVGLGGVQSGGAPSPTTRGTYREVVRDGALLRLTAANVVFVLSDLVLEVVLALYISRKLGLPVWWTSVILSFATVLSVLAQTSVVAAVENRPPSGVLRVSAMLWAVAFLGMVFIYWVPPAGLTVVLLFVIITVHTVPSLVADPVLRTTVASRAPEGCLGRYMATYQLSWTVSEVIAPVTFAWLYTKNASLPWLVLAVSCAACVILLPRRKALFQPVAA